MNPSAMTAAHRTKAFGSQVTVTSQRSGRSVTVRINDRGPFVKGRCIDLSTAAAHALDPASPYAAIMPKIEARVNERVGMTVHQLPP